MQTSFNFSCSRHQKQAGSHRSLWRSSARREILLCSLRIWTAHRYSQALQENYLVNICNHKKPQNKTENCTVTLKLVFTFSSPLLRWPKFKLHFADAVNHVCSPPKYKHVSSIKKKKEKDFHNHCLLHDCYLDTPIKQRVSWYWHAAQTNNRYSIVGSKQGGKETLYWELIFIFLQPPVCQNDAE